MKMMNTRRTYQWLSVILVMALILSSCSKSAEVAGDQPAGELKIEEAEPLVDRDPVDSEVEIFNLLNSGFFYSSTQMAQTDDELKYIELRNLSLNLLTDKFLDLTDSAYKLTENSLDYYENHLLRYLDSSEMSDDQEGVMQITEGMLAYRTAISSLNEEIHAYYGLLESDSELKPTLQSTLFTQSMKLFNLADAYLEFLLQSRDYIALAFGESHAETRPTFNAHADKIYEEQIAQDYSEMMLTYLDASELYAYISSADYYAGGSYQGHLKLLLDQLDDSEDAMQLKGMFDRGILDSNIPMHLIQPEVPAETTEISYLDSIRRFFIIDSYADDDSSIEDAITVLTVIENVEQFSRYSNSQDPIADAIMSVILSGAPASQKVDLPAVISADDPQEESALRTEIKTALKENAPVKAAGIVALENEKKAQNLKKKIVESLRDGQKKLKILGMGKEAEKLFGGDGSNTLDAQYTLLIGAMSQQLKDKGSALSSEMFEKVNQLLNKDLEELLGEKKEDFVNKFIETNAEDLVDKFLDWKKNALNFDDLQIDKDTLLSLLSSMGIELKSPEAVAQTTPDQTPPEADNTAVDIDDYLPKTSSMPGLKSLGMDIFSGGERSDGPLTYYTNFRHGRPKEYTAQTEHANLYTFVSVKISYNMPDAKGQARPFDRSNLTRVNPKAYDNESGEDYLFNARKENRGIGNSGVRYELISGNLTAIKGPMLVQINFNDFMIEEYPQAKSIMKAFVADMLSKVGADPNQFKPSENPVKTPDVQSDSTLEGTLSLLNLHKAKNMKVDVSYFSPAGDFITSETVMTDADGKFTLPFAYPKDQGYKAILSIPLIYFDDEGDALTYVTDKTKNINEPIVIFGGEYLISSADDLNIACDLYSGIAYGNEPVEGINHIDSQTYVYFYQTMMEAIDYYQYERDFTFDSRLPIRLILNENVESTKDAMGYYNFELDAIHVLEDYTKIDSEDMPHLIYHELSHYIMTMLYYPDYPGGRSDDADTYHGGYANSYTGYSYSEGFAFFMESIMGLYYYNEPAVANGSLEENHKAWENSGFSETLAVASVLYDLIDSGTEDDDSVALEFDALWQILSQNQRHFGDVYDDLKSNHPDLSNEIDQIFIDHGFFVVTDRYEEGAGVYNFGEAFVDANGNNVYDESEVFYDYNAMDENGTAIQEYRDGYTVGYAGYADRVDRK